MKRRLAAAFLFVSLTAGTAARAEILWRGDFESGDLSQWPAKQLNGADRLEVVGSPVREGRHALKVTVKPGDYVNSGARNEVIYWPNISEGSERYYKWYTLWPADYQSPDVWQLFFQFHHTGNSGSPPVDLYVRGEEVRLNQRSEGGSGNVLWRTKLQRGVWHEFVLHVKWSSDPKRGFLSLYYDRELVLPKTAVSTLFPGQLGYWKQGLYRDRSVDVTQTLFHDGTLEATELSDVFPVQAEPPPSPAPTSDAGVQASPVAPMPPPVADPSSGPPAREGPVVSAPASGEGLTADPAGATRTGCGGRTGTPAFMFLSILGLVLARRA